MKKLLGLLVVLSIGAAFGYGRWPERELRLTREGENALLRLRLEEAEATVRMCALLGQAQDLAEAVSRGSHAEAEGLATRFFDAARAESNRNPRPGFKEALEAVNRSRDGVTAALARADRKALAEIHRAQNRLRAALGQGRPEPSRMRLPAPEAGPAVP
ncbi:MAG: hypothetical protein KJ067_09775 [Vicinamibacteria bacterium]|nr:hypothetical protein [Vicinamibacteria bacterium]